MIIIKCIVLIFVFSSSFMIGNLIAKKYTNRVKELRDMKNALNMFETKVSFTYEAVPEIFAEISNQMEGTIKEIFKLATEKMKVESAGKAWIESIDSIDTSMNEEDKTILKNLGKLLGKTDIDGQISEIKLVNEFIDTQIELAQSEQIKNVKMYKSLGGIIGLTLVIILI